MSKGCDYKYKAVDQPQQPPSVFTAPPVNTQENQQSMSQQTYTTESAYQTYADNTTQQENQQNMLQTYTTEPAYPKNADNTQCPQPTTQQNTNDFSGAHLNNNNDKLIYIDTTSGWHGFSNKKRRRRFVRKVYSILSIQLLFTFGIIALFVFTPPINRWAHQSLWAFLLSFIIFFVIYLTLMCCKRVRRIYPANMVLLAIFTLALSFMAAMICVSLDIISVLIAVGITALCCATVSALSFYTKFDFTKFVWALVIAGFAVFFASFLILFIHVKLLDIVYAGAGSVIYLMFLAYNTQLICGGKKHEISPEEYILGTILLYVDIVFIFISFLRH